VGYYNPTARKSFFYPDENLEATFFHELTHQLFNESSQFEVAPNVGSAGGAWMLEGIALYMESLQDHEHHWTVGGFETPRLQTARYRAIRDGYWPEWKAYSSGTIDAWKADADVALYYSHAAGLTHMLLDRVQNSAAARNGYMAALRGVYQGRQGAGRDLIEQLGSSPELARDKFQELMTVTDADVLLLGQRGLQVKDLVLAGSQLQPATWQSLAEQTGLQWLDLSFSNATMADLANWIGELRELQRLSFEGTGVDGGVLHGLSKLPHLVELDLSRCAITDADLRALEGCQPLATLWLSKTGVTEACLETLAKLPALQFCDVQGTAISPAAWEAFQQKYLSLAKSPE
jgi:nucleotide-binding universal stress UspA family protein